MSKTKAKTNPDNFEFPELVELWPDYLREDELSAQSEMSDKALSDYEFECLSKDSDLPNGMFV